MESKISVNVKGSQRIFCPFGAFPELTISVGYTRETHLSTGFNFTFFHQGIRPIQAATLNSNEEGKIYDE